MTGQDWRHRAACRDQDPELFFPMAEGGHGGRSASVINQVRAARAVCAPCPVRAECLTEAMELGDDYGIRGGLTSDERRELRRPTPPSAPAVSRPLTIAQRTALLAAANRPSLSLYSRDGTESVRAELVRLGLARARRGVNEQTYTTLTSAGRLLAGQLLAEPADARTG